MERCPCWPTVVSGCELLVEERAPAPGSLGRLTMVLTETSDPRCHSSDCPHRCAQESAVTAVVKVTEVFSRIFPRSSAAGALSDSGGEFFDLIEHLTAL